ncbi:MAG: hypothetical protein CMC55_02020 [Flavobacteriaceae bacterium]|uniref:hypothetical protein n=1 Tax=Bizionia echini TaxID=649333 RepID=UPI000C96D2A0|nr:hypothetical protein [Flavobacteriaceae bacterium]
MKKLLILIFVLVSQISFAQEIIVKGNVVDDYEIPFAGSQVINIRTDEKVITDFDGNYQIIGKIGDTLIFKAYEKVEECFTISKRLVFSKESIEVKLRELKYINLKDCDIEPKELLVFVGKMNYMHSVFDNSPCADNFNDHGIGEYEIVEPIYGDFSIENNSIKFNTSEHAYIDSFISNKHKYALLFIRKYCDDKYYLVFHRDIFRTKNNKWAIKYYNPKRSWYFNGMDSIENKISDIKFKNASVRAKNVDSAKKYLKAPYYKQRGRKFIPLKGFYVDDYFKLWKSSQKEWTYDN